ncbi:demethoxyubiquinone hydroxylase family protein [Haladaptatus sp. DFWS20]|uniref:demethoxyubiquinone hydroxylase family protein n=1 Tax=Haladaptatus sp. DFWS20 TaxID=3403467 RepID=UPI003EBE7CAB
MASEDSVERYQANRQAEIDSSTIYRAIADAESRSELAEVYRRLAASEEEHAHFWETQLQEAGVQPGDRHPSWRARTLGWLAQRFGPAVVLPIVTASERTDSRDYAAQPEAKDTDLPSHEQSHARLLDAIETTTGGGLEGGTLAQLEGRHRSASGNALRAAVLGANDGLISNLSLVMGVAGAALSASSILITGLAGLLAGAGSMAMGEWLSVQSSRELYQRQIAIEAEELAAVPEEEEQELSLIYQSKGLPQEQAKQLAAQLVANQEKALDTLAREELGGSAWEAAGASFILFAFGAIVPVVPFFFLTGILAVGGSLILSAGALFLIGAGITLLTGRSLLYSGFRQVIIGLAAAGLTYGVGSLIGVAIAG